MNRAMASKVLGGCLTISLLGAVVAVAAEKHAAIAYSEASHKYGWAADQPTVKEAHEKALAQCGAGCTVRVAWHNGCGAYAEGQKNDHYGWALGKTRKDAEQLAVAACAKRGGSKCTARLWACN